MKAFTQGHTYEVCGGGYITVTKRTPHYITFTGSFTGRRKIRKDEHYGLGEVIRLGEMFKCFSGHDHLIYQVWMYNRPHLTESEETALLDELRRADSQQLETYAH